MRLACGLLVALLAGCSSGARDGKAQYQAAVSEFQRGDIPRAAQLAAQGLKTFAGRPQSDSYWSFRLLDAEILLAESKPSEALALVQNPAPAEPAELDIRRQIVEATALANLGQPGNALARLDSAQPLAAKLVDSPLLAQALILRGSILARTGSIEDAERVLLSAVSQAAALRQPYYEAAAFTNLSFANFRRAHFEDAIQFGERALALAEPIQARRIAGSACTNTAASYARLGDFDRAIPIIQKAVTLQKSAGDERHMEESLAELGNLHLLEGDSAGAVPAYREAFEIARRNKLTSDASKWADNLASAFIDLRQWDEAEQWNATARKLKQQISDDASLPYVELNDALIAEARGRADEAERQYLHVIAGRGGDPDLQWEAHGNLGRFYAHEGRLQDAGRELNRALAGIDRQRAAVRGAAERIKFLARLMRFYQDYVDVRVEQGDDAGALQAVESARARVLAERLQQSETQPAVTPQQLQALARSTGTTLLSYWIAPKRSFVWVITATGTHRAGLPPAPDVEALVAAHRRAVEDDLSDPAGSGNDASLRLSQMLLGPALSSIPQGGRVILAPDGALHRINFETLPIASPRPHYWGEDVVLSLAPSFSVLKNEAAGVGEKSVLLVGAPAPADAAFPPPSYAPVELADIEKHLSVREKLTGAAATPEAYRLSNPARFQLIHFAAHADANRVSPLDSSVILARGRNGYRLYARDVAGIPLHANLVTVSSCRSAGVKAYNGEGLVGFAWAFLGAGARRVIAGLWDVNDSSTAQLMDSMYAEIAQGRDPAEALHDAKVKMIAGGGNFRKPYYWGPFQLYSRVLAPAR